MNLPDLTLVLGGASSGKSAYAEDLARASGLGRIYLATAEAHDTEMRRKIDRHRQLRGTGWTTIEAPLEPGEAICATQPGQIVLLDCATMWLSNHLLAESDLTQVEERLFEALERAAAPVIIVSNEVGLSVVPENRLARRFTRVQGALNQALAARAGLVVNVMAGLPQVLKGTLG